MFAKRIAGIDITPNHIKAVELFGSVKQPQFFRAAMRIWPENVMNDGMFKDPVAASQIIADLWKQTGFRAKNVIMGVSNRHVLVRIVNMELPPSAKLNNAIRYQAQEYLPVSVKDVELDHLIIQSQASEDAKKTKVMLVAAAKRMLEQYVGVFHDAGLRVQDIDVAFLALPDILDDEQKSGIVLLIHLCSAISALLILKDGKPVLVRPLSASLMPFAKENPMKLEPDVLDKMVELISGDVETSISYYQSIASDDIIKTAYVSGFCCENTLLFERLEDLLNIPVTGVESFSMVRTDKHKIDQLQRPGAYGIAVGLAMRGLEAIK